jgi:hypothetical protein
MAEIEEMMEAEPIELDEASGNGKGKGRWTLEQRQRLSESLRESYARKRGIAWSTKRWQIPLIRIVMGIAGIGATLLSVYFNVTRLESFMPLALAALFGGFMVLFEVVAFLAVMVFVARKSYIFAGIFIALWGVVVVFTLSATLSGFYTAYTATRTERIARGSSELIGRQALEGVRANIDSLTIRLTDQRRQFTSLQDIVEDASSSVERRAEYGRVFYDAEMRILSVQREMDRLQGLLDAERGKERQILSETPTVAASSRQDFFEFLGGVLHIPPSRLEMLLALLPSFFVDVIASVGLSVALFL